MHCRRPALGRGYGILDCPSQEKGRVRTYAARAVPPAPLDLYAQSSARTAWALLRDLQVVSGEVLVLPLQASPVADSECLARRGGPFPPKSARTRLPAAKTPELESFGELQAMRNSD